MRIVLYLMSRAIIIKYYKTENLIKIIIWILQNKNFVNIVLFLKMDMSLK